MSNISFFFPKENKDSALGLNAGLGNLGVSVVQFLMPHRHLHGAVRHAGR